MLPQQQQWIECARRLTELQGSPNCVSYCSEAPLSGKKGKWISIFGNCATGEIFVEVTDDRTTRVESFQSRHKNCPAEERRKDMPLVDTADAFVLARTLCRRWPTQINELSPADKMSSPIPKTSSPIRDP